MATEIQQLGQALAGDVLAWGSAAIGIALVAMVVLWVARLLRG